MGLPVFKTPIEPEVGGKASEKVTAGHRSSIRRRSTPRSPYARLSSESRRRRMLGLVERASPEEYEIWEGRPRSPPHDGGLPSFSELQTGAHRAIEDERSRTIRTFGLERQAAHSSTSEADGPLMPPVPESRDYSGLESYLRQQAEARRLRRSGQDPRRLARRNHASTPPYTISDALNLNHSGTDSPRPSSLTPARSPHPLAGILGPLNHDGGSDYDLHAVDLSPSEIQYTDNSGSILSERVRAFNIATNNLERSRRLLRQTRLDGLGDRDRSISPIGEWDTFITSITPDPQPPSAGSSFAATSAAAHASSSSNSGPASASTSMTSIDRTYPPTLRDCDGSDLGSNADEDEEDIFELHGPAGIRLGEERLERSTGDSFASISNRAESLAVRDSALGADAENMGGMHRIISRLAARDEIPDEWWTSAGLSRNLRRDPSI